MADITLNTIRERATKFAAEFADVEQENAEAQTFWNEFFEVFDQRRRSVAMFEKQVEKASGKKGRADLLFPSELAVEHKTAGKDLDKAMRQLWNYLPRLPEGERPWLLVACDFQTFKWENLDTREGGKFPLADLPDHVGLFAWMAGHAKPNAAEFTNDEDASLAATELLAEIHDQMVDNGYQPHPLREWLTRILFCLFAEDTGVWPRAAFHQWLAANTREDGSDLGSQISWLFQVLNTAPDERPGNLPELMAEFTYINGDLFEETLPVPSCDTATRDALLAACRFDWSALSPAIFGSMFQNVMEPAERRQLGAHYTSEENILKTIRPLFLDDLEAELEKATSKPKLQAFLDQLGSLTFFDPACGCGNFLVIAYREIRKLETEALRRLTGKQKKGRYGLKGQGRLDITLALQVTVDQFYGIEIEEFPAKIARTALYLVDHLANREVSREFGQYFIRFPIPAQPHIANDNALTLDWDQVLPAAQADYVFGNPPFGGHKEMTSGQKADLKGAWETNRVAHLDFVTGWYAKILRYLDPETDAEWAFVSTSSIAMGENVARLFTPIFDAGWHIKFAHRPFKWTNEASGPAAVHVVIVGFTKDGGKRRLFEYDDPRGEPEEASPAAINAYLLDGPDVMVTPESSPLSPGLPELRAGSTPIDWGLLTQFTDDELEEVRSDPRAAKYLRRYAGGNELINGTARWCLWMDTDDFAPNDTSASPVLKRRVEGLRAKRTTSDRATTKELAQIPHLFGERRQPTSDRFLCIPQTFSENRPWVTAALEDQTVVPSIKLFTVDDTEGFLFAVVSSSMFIVWARTVGGKLESRFSLSSSIVWNTLPLPEIDDALRGKIIKAGRGVRDARDLHPDRTLAEHYNPLAMDPALVKAHRELDRHVDKAFGAARVCKSEQQRQKILFERYAELTAGGD